MGKLKNSNIAGVGVAKFVFNWFQRFLFTVVMAKCRLYLKLYSVWYRNTCSPNRRTHGLRTATKFSCVSSLVSPQSHTPFPNFPMTSPKIRLLYTQNSLTQRNHFTVVLVASSKCASTYILPRVMSIGVIICSIQADHLWYSRAPATVLTNSSLAWTNTSGIDETYRETTRHIM